MRKKVKLKAKQKLVVKITTSHKLLKTLSRLIGPV